MALKHQLSLNIVAGCNPNNFTIIDTSNYSSGISISCPTLAITIPGTSGPVYFSQGTNPAPGLDPEDVYHLLPTTPDPYTGTPKFVITVDNILLCLQAQGSTLTALYDGLWTIEYCVNPCTTTSVKYYYLRNTSALHKYAGLLCKLRLSNCLPSDET